MQGRYRENPWRGHLFLAAGFALYDGPVGTTAEHRHHALQLMWADGPGLQLVLSGRRRCIRSGGIAADEPHAIAEPCARAVVAYVEPESAAGRGLSRVLSRGGSARGSVYPLRALARQSLPELPLTSDTQQARSLMALLGIDRHTAEVAPGSYPPAIEQLVRILPGRLDEPVRLGRLAGELGLSTGHLSHLMADHIGMPFRRYVLWLRLLAATKAMGQGSTLTEAAHAAGFADSAHLNRTFRRMFGIAPSEVSRSVTWHLL